MMLKRIYLSLALISVLVISFAGCKQIQNISNALGNVQRLKFKLDNVSSFRMAGVDISRIRSVSDLSVSDGFKLTSAYASKKLPVQFTLNVAAINPNDGTGGSKAAEATITSIDWILYIDNVQTVNGVMDTPIKVPGRGESVNIPLQMGLDLMEFMKNESYDKLVNLAMNIGGLGGEPSRLKLDIKPTVQTSLGPISYPGRITVIDKEYR